MIEFPGRLYGFAAALVFSFVALVVFAPLVVVGPTLPVRRFFGRLGIRCALACIGVPLRVQEWDRLPKTPCIAVANHASYADGVLLCAVLPSRFTFVVQDGAGRWPYVGLVLRRMGATFVNRTDAREGASQARALVKRVAAGESLAIFAEGGFHPQPGLHAFKKGAFLIAARAGVPVAPIGIRGTRRLYGGDRLLPRWSRVEIEIGAPVPASADALALRAAARTAILAACGEPDASPSAA